MLYAAFILGFAGSFHCVAMCGAITLAFAPKRIKSTSFIAGKLLYNLGRILTYSMLGLLLGASKLVFGAMLFDIHAMQEWLSISIGIAMLGTLVLPKAIRLKFSATPIITRYWGKIRSQMGRFLQSQNVETQFYLGMVNGLLPCGFVYMALALAALSSTLQEATFTMMLFGAGTIPAMLLLAFAAQFSEQKFRFTSKYQRFTPFLTAIVAVLFILRGLSLGIPYISPELHATPAGLEAGCHVHGK